VPTQNALCAASTTPSPRLLPQQPPPPSVADQHSRSQALAPAPAARFIAWSTYCLFKRMFFLCPSIGTHDGARQAPRLALSPPEPVTPDRLQAGSPQFSCQAFFFIMIIYDPHSLLTATYSRRVCSSLFVGDLSRVFHIRDARARRKSLTAPSRRRSKTISSQSLPWETLSQKA
jgi:hypothetical protein